MPFVSLQKTLAKVLKENKITGDLDLFRIFPMWSDIVGDKTAQHTRPSRIKDHILYVEVDDPMWLTQLRYMKIDILEKIDMKIKQGAFKDLRFFLKPAC
jgi:predicted nucleic acid-binding Zn ribbon protein